MMNDESRSDFWIHHSSFRIHRSEDGGLTVRPPWVYGLALLALLPGGSPSQNASPRELPAAWARSGNETAAKPAAVIASTRSGEKVLPADARVSVPDDGLLSPPAKPAAAKGPAPGTIQQAVYVSNPEAPPSNPIQTVAAGPAGPPVSGGRPVAHESLLAVQVLGPQTAAPGQIVTCEIVVRNAGTAAVSGVGIDLPLPQGLRVLGGKPEPERDDGRVSWHLGNLEPGAERHLELEIQLGQAGDLSLTPTARFTAAMGLRTNIIRPPFSASVQGPESAAVGEKVVFQVQIGNHTGDPIRRIGLRCELPAGLLHPQGQVIEADLAEDLAPGQVRTIPLETQARQPGRHTLTVAATGEGNRTARATASLLVSEPAVTVALTGTRKAAVGQDVLLQAEVTNPARKPCRGVRLSQGLPQGVEFVSASTGGVYNPVTQTVSWDLPEMLAEQRQTVTCQLRARQVGDWAMALNLSIDGTPRGRATHAVQVEATPALSLELTALDDPIPAGRDAVYEVRVYNGGQAAARGVRLVVQAPENLAPVNAEGPTPWQVRGQQVFFEPLAELRGRVDAVYRVRVRGMAPGEGHLRAELHAAGLSRPLVQELTGHVQGVAAAPVSAGR
jgi:uncharacterized repeat protein (TIGR01451 family)